MILRTRALVSAGVSARRRGRVWRFVGTLVTTPRRSTRASFGRPAAHGGRKVIQELVVFNLRATPVYRRAASNRREGGRRRSAPREERVQHPHEVLRCLDVRGVSGGELDHSRVE